MTNKYKKHITDEISYTPKFKSLDVFIRDLIDDLNKIFKLNKQSEINIKIIKKELDLLLVNTKKNFNKRGGKLLEKPGYLNGTGTSGSLGTLANDMSCSVQALFQTMEHGFEAIVDLVKLPMDMGTAFEAKNAPNPSSIKID